MSDEKPMVVKKSWDEFRDRWLEGLKRDGLSVGVNWSGARATGYEVEPDSVRRNVEYHLRDE